MNKWELLKYILVLSPLVLPVSPGFAQEALDPNAEVVELEEVVVVGSRLPGRSALDSPVPVDVILGDAIRNYGVRDIDSLLSATIPSYNITTQPISDAATLVRPANLRGLPPDSTLVLVNGKRRHRSSVITFLGGGISDGSHAPDLAVIPAIALKRVEVLRDGASAQYGSDAVAGVINFVLKDAPDGGTLETRWGQFYQGDGDTFNIAGNLGLPLRKAGFANFSFEYNQADPTSRSVQLDNAQGLIDAGNTHVRQPDAQIWGSPKLHYDYKLFGNLGHDLAGGMEAYAFGNIARRRVEGGFFFRNPCTVRASDVQCVMGVGATNPRKGVFVDANSDLLPKVNGFSFRDLFPGGFTPTFGATVRDWSAAFGLRGKLSHDNAWLNGWRYDLSAVFGQHGTEFVLHNTINPQLIRLGLDIPTDYKPGAYTETDRVFNFDLSRPFATNIFSSPLNLALGMEYREEEFEIEAGDENSWFIDTTLPEGFGVGSNGFAGFPPRIAGKFKQGSYAGYLDMEADVVKDVLVGVAGRYENYETFGDTLNGKVVARWQATDSVALRSSFSTGFRAPTAGQANVQNVTTEFIGGTLADRVTLPPTHPGAMLKGGEELKPEKSVNISAGIVFNVGDLAVTTDYYHIKVKDRIALTSNLPLDNNDRQTLIAANVPDASSFTSVRFFTNDFDTTTQGIDVVATYPMEIFGGDTTFTLAGNWNQTEVTKFNPAIINSKRVTQLEESLPSFRSSLTADHLRGPWRFLTRLRYYDDFVEFHANTDAFRIDASERLLVDAEASYTFKLGVTLAAGAENLFDTFPTKNPHKGKTGSKYPESSPYGFDGGFYYLKASYAF